MYVNYTCTRTQMLAGENLGGFGESTLKKFFSQRFFDFYLIFDF